MLFALQVLLGGRDDPEDTVARQLEVDLLTDLSNVLAIEHGLVPPEYLVEARAAWPDDA